MQITIIGVGAMATLFGAKLNHLAQVNLVGHWPAQLAALTEKGLILEEANGRQTHHHLHATNQPESLPKANLVIILVKSHQTAQAARLAKGLLVKNGLILTLQNGLGNVETLTAVFNSNQVMTGITSAGAAIVKPGHTRLAGLGHTYLANLPKRSAPIREIISLFRQAGFPTDLTDNPDSLIWGKLAVNAGINPLTAVLQMPNGFLAENPRAQQLMMQAANEVTAVAQAKQITLPFPDAGIQALSVARNTASNHSSMWQDVQRGTQTEIEAISGAIIRHGREHNIPTPTNLILYQCMKKIENQTWQQPASPETTLDYLYSRLEKLEEPT